MDEWITGWSDGGIEYKIFFSLKYKTDHSFLSTVRNGYDGRSQVYMQWYKGTCCLLLSLCQSASFSNGCCWCAVETWFKLYLHVLWYIFELIWSFWKLKKEEVNVRFCINKWEKWCIKCTSISNWSLSKQIQQCVILVAVLRDVRNKQHLLIT
jgi:hypothetical protein